MKKTALESLEMHFDAAYPRDFEGFDQRIKVAMPDVSV
jgi:hypothetical protein